MKRFKSFLCVTILCLPIFGLSNTLASSLNHTQKKASSEKEIHCIATNITMEALGESIKGQIAVFSVMKNRVNSNKYGKTFCQVTYSKGQFSWTRKGKTKKVPKDIANLARQLYNNRHQHRDITGGAINYHAVYVRPNWKGFKKTTRIGNHVFYRKIAMK